MSASILVIEDDPASLELARYLLSASGYTVICATRGDEGLALARRQRPDLVICDIYLPGMTGFDIARTLRADAAFATIPLIAVTASAMQGDRSRVLDAGFDEYLSKPIDPVTFTAQVATFLGDSDRS